MIFPLNESGPPSTTGRLVGAQSRISNRDFADFSGDEKIEEARKAGINKRECQFWIVIVHGIDSHRQSASAQLKPCPGRLALCCEMCAFFIQPNICEQINEWKRYCAGTKVHEDLLVEPKINPVAKPGAFPECRSCINDDIARLFLFSCCNLYKCDPVAIEIECRNPPSAPSGDVLAEIVGERPHLGEFPSILILKHANPHVRPGREITQICGSAVATHRGGRQQGEGGDWCLIIEVRFLAKLTAAAGGMDREQRNTHGVRSIRWWKFTRFQLIPRQFFVTAVRAICRRLAAGLRSEGEAETDGKECWFHPWVSSEIGLILSTNVSVLTSIVCSMSRMRLERRAVSSAGLKQWPISFAL